MPKIPKQKETKKICGGLFCCSRPETYAALLRRRGNITYVSTLHVHLGDETRIWFVFSDLKDLFIFLHNETLGGVKVQRCVDTRIVLATPTGTQKTLKNTLHIKQPR